MGITIHYSGRFNPNASLEELVIEVKEIAENFNWPHRIFETEFPEQVDDDNTHNGKVYGIQITPPEFESVDICFLSNRRMSGLINLMLWNDATNPTEREYIYKLHSKSQFAGPHLHKTVIELFRHLNKRAYFAAFELYDESAYWETKDEVLMQQNFKFLGEMIENMSLAANTTSQKADESYEDYFERLSKMILKRNKLN
jgi:hypothetical protein